MENKTNLKKEMAYRLMEETGADLGYCTIALREGNYNYEDALNYIKENYRAVFHMDNPKA